MRAKSRREVVRAGLLVTASGALGSPWRLAAEAFPTDPRSRVAIATYPFRAMLLAPGNRDRDPAVKGMDLAGFARYIRAEFGVKGIEPLHSHFASTRREDVLALRRAFDAAGVRTVNIPVDEEADLGSEDPAVRAAGLATYKRWIDVAVVLGSPSIRIGLPKCAGPADVTGPAAALRPVVRYASERGVIVNLENDDPVLASAARIVAVLKLANTPYLRGLPDFGNSLMGGDEAFNADAVRAMFGFASNIAHVKDAEEIAGERRTASLEELFAIAKKAKYRGYYSMESDSGVDPATDTKKLVEQTIALL